MVVAAPLVTPTIIIEEAGPGEPLKTLAVVLNYGIGVAFLVEAVVMVSVMAEKCGGSASIRWKSSSSS